MFIKRVLTAGESLLSAARSCIYVDFSFWVCLSLGSCGNLGSLHLFSILEMVLPVIHSWEGHILGGRMRKGFIIWRMKGSVSLIMPSDNM